MQLAAAIIEVALISALGVVAVLLLLGALVLLAKIYRVVKRPKE
jgi:hypothetical protein